MSAVCRRTLLGLILVLLISGTATTLSIDNRSGPAQAGPDHTFPLSDAGMVTDVPYVWQEINGFCHWASVSMAVQSLGINLDLHDVFVTAALGFSMAYVRLDDVLVVAPGAIMRQLPSQRFMCELYGLNMSVYVDANSGIGSTTKYILESQGVAFTEIFGTYEALELMRTSIDQGIPLIQGVDPYYLPPETYDVAREMQITIAQYGGGHSVVLVGYNDTSQTVTIMDSGVDAFGENFGYPDDGSGIYEMNYTVLADAWGATGFLTNRMTRVSDPATDYDSRLLGFITDRLRGDREANMDDIEDAFFLSFGADAFRALGLDMTAESLGSYLDEFDEGLRYYMLLDFALQVESACTLQYLSFREAIEAIPALFPDDDLSGFISAGEEALPHLNALSDNATWISIDPFSHSNLLWDTFLQMAELYNSTKSLATAFTACQTKIDEIVSHLLAISDAWNAAADELERVLPRTPLLGGLPTVVIGTFVLGIVALVVVLLRRR